MPTHALGWLGLIQKFTRKDGKYYAQLKLVDPDSEEARRLEFTRFLKAKWDFAQCLCG